MRILGLIAALVALLTPAAGAQPVPQAHGFITHAAFFSLESKQPNLLDPQVFVADAAAPGGTGPQGIVHAAGVRPAYGVDDPDAPAANATGTPLGFTLGRWFGARGRATLAAAEGATTLTYAFTDLIPGGVYSFFENHFTSSGVTFTPLDGTGQHNTFTAGRTGNAAGSIVVPGLITHAEGVLLVYHSDRTAHRMERGHIGVDAHHQLILRLP